MKVSAYLLCSVMVALWTPHSSAAVESYTTTTGVTVDAETAILGTDSVTFRRADGLHVTVPLAKLSAADITRARQQAGAPSPATAPAVPTMTATPTPSPSTPSPTQVASVQPASSLMPPPGSAKLPPLRVDAQVGTKRDNQRNSSYMQNMTISPQVSIEGPSTSPLPALEATMMVVVMDTEAKYRDRVERYQVLSREAMTAPAVPTGKLRKFEFKTSVTSFDAYRDASNIGGKVYKWFVFTLKDPASGQLVSFQTNCKELETAARRNPELVTKTMALGINDVFSTTFK
jgi:hypothetical protein